MSPLPTPSKGEAQSKFVSRCMSNETVKREFGKGSKQSVAVCNSQWRKKHGGKAPGKKEISIHFCNYPITLKETEDKEFYSEGFVVTTHPDRDNSKVDSGIVGQILSKNACYQIADFINKGQTAGKPGNPRAVSISHDWIKKNDTGIDPAGLAVIDDVNKATVRETGDGHFGVWVKTHHKKNHPEYENIIYDVQHKYIPGYSAEFYQGDTETININNETFEMVNSVDDFIGYGFAKTRKIANQDAKITNFGYKEIEDKIKSKEVKQMPEEEQPKEEENKEKVPPKEEETPKEETPKEEGKSNDVDVKEIVMKEVKKEIEKLRPKVKVLKGDSGDTENITIKELNRCIKEADIDSYNDVLSESKMVDEALKDPANYGISAPRLGEATPTSLKVKCVGKGLRITGLLKTKGTLDTATHTSDYTQAAVEFADLFAPGIIDTFNNQTNLWGYLRKEQHIGGTHYQWKMVTDKDPDSNATFVDRDDVTVLKTYATKKNYQTPLKVARRGVSVTDFTLRYSARSLGDLFQLEVSLQSKEMMNDVNAALFAEVLDGTGNSPLGLEAVADSVGNTTMYGLTRSTTNRLSPDAAADTYGSSTGALTEAVLRGAFTSMEEEGTRGQDISIITSPTGRQYVYDLMDTNRRFMTTQAAFGFNKLTVPTFDGFPIIVDHDCNSDDIFIIDGDADVIIIGMEPRLVNLAKVGAATEAYIEMHFAHVYKQPRRIHMLQGVSAPS